MPAAREFSLMSLGQVLLLEEDAEAARHHKSSSFGLYGCRDEDGTHRLHRDCIDIRLAGPEAGDPAVDGYLEQHGPGVAVIALAVPEPEAALAQAVARGARQVETYPGRQLYGVPGILSPGGYVHVFTRHGEQESLTHREEEGVWDSGLMRIDHFAVCLPAGTLEEAVGWYEGVLDFATTFKEEIRVGEQGMNSKVVQNPLGDVTFTLIEPDPTLRPGQIDTFLDQHGGAGVQHVAFSSSDVLSTVKAMRERGVEFLGTPTSYYEQLPQRLPRLAHAAADLQRESVLVDEDHGGQLFQIFTRSTHPRGTLFYEVIERVGATTFGSGNITALYEAVEAQRTAGPGAHDAP